MTMPSSTESFQIKRKDCRIVFQIHKDVAGNIYEFLRITEMVAVIATKLNMKYELNVVQAYVVTSSHDDA